MGTLYSAKINSPYTTILTDITSASTTIRLGDITILPEAPNILTIGYDTEDPEVVLFNTAPSGSNLVVTRGFQGTAKAWLTGTKVARTFTAYDYDQLRLLAHEHMPQDGIIETSNGYINKVTIGDLEYTIVRENSKITSITNGEYTYEFTRDINGKIVSWNTTLEVGE